MPLTPFHLGPGLFFGLVFIKYLDFFSFLIGNVILDIEPLFAVLSNLNKPYSSFSHHGFFHTIFGAFLLSFITALILNKFKSKIQRAFQKFKLQIQEFSFLKIFLSVFLGTLTHLVFDSLMHYDVFPFWPSRSNPFLREISFSQNYSFCIVFGVLGIVLLGFKLKRHKN